jgi:hypothetical protein
MRIFGVDIHRGGRCRRLGMGSMSFHGSVSPQGKAWDDVVLLSVAGG